MSRRKQRSKERKWARRAERDARPNRAAALSKFVRLVNDGEAKDPQAFAVLRNIAAGRVSPYDWRVIHERIGGEASP